MYLSSHPTQRTRPAPFSTGHFPRPCRVCGNSFQGLGALCPSHLAQHARARAREIESLRQHSELIFSEREQLTRADRAQFVELPDPLDA